MSHAEEGSFLLRRMRSALVFLRRVWALALALSRTKFKTTDMMDTSRGEL
jgi:hypothetical protein